MPEVILSSVTLFVVEEEQNLTKDAEVFVVFAVDVDDEAKKEETREEVVLEVVTTLRTKNLEEEALNIFLFCFLFSHDVEERYIFLDRLKKTLIISFTIFLETRQIAFRFFQILNFVF